MLEKTLSIISFGRITEDKRCWRRGTLVLNNIFSGDNSPFFLQVIRISEKLQIISEFLQTYIMKKRRHPKASIGKVT